MVVSLKQIAAETNVSIATVSKALSHRSDVADKTRLRVLEVAQRMNYRPNLLVRGMQTGKTRNVGLMVPCGRDAFTSSIVSGVHMKLQARNYVPFLLSASKSPDGSWRGLTELQVIHQLVDRRVDGLIIRPVEDNASDSYLQEIHEHRLPLVAVDRALQNSHRADFVGTDDYLGGQLAARHLLELGHRRLMHLAGPDFASTARQRKAGFESVLRKAPQATYTIQSDQTYVGDQARVDRLLQQDPMPTAIFAANDYLACAVYAALEKRGLRVGRDVSVVGFADLPLTGYLSPALTTIRQDPFEVGQRAAHLLLNRIDTPSPRPDEHQPVHILLKPELVLRASTGVPPR